MDQNNSRSNVFWKNNALKSGTSIPKNICNHLIDKRHSTLHKCIVGISIICFGVLIVKLASLFDNFTIHFIGEGLGYLIHGIGSIPFIEYIIKHYRS